MKILLSEIRHHLSKNPSQVETTFSPLYKHNPLLYIYIYIQIEIEIDRERERERERDIYFLFINYRKTSSRELILKTVSLALSVFIVSLFQNYSQQKHRIYTIFTSEFIGASLKRVIWSTGVLIVVDKLVCRGSSTKRFHSYWAINGVEGELRAYLLTIFSSYFLFSKIVFYVLDQKIYLAIQN